MKLIEEIKKAEEKGEILKKNAEIEGQQLLDKAREMGEKEITNLDAVKEKMTEKELAEAKKIIDAEMRKLDAEQSKILKKINDMFEKNKSKAIDKVQDLILKWPLSQ
jgi:hypothetical protein